MAYTLRLDIYYFHFKKITDVIQRKRRGGGISTGYRTESELTNFCDFVSSLVLQKEEKSDYMKVLIRDFVNGFNSSFAINEENTRAISLLSDYKVNSRNYTTWGTFRGGETGIARDIYKTNDSTNSTTKIQEDNVSTLQFYYKIWIPYDSNVGILMLQSYTTLGCTALFKKQFENYIIGRGYKIFWSKCIPDEYIKEFFKKGYINKICITHQHKNTDTFFGGTFGPVNFAKKETVLSKLQIPLAELFSCNNYQKLLKADIRSVDLNYDEEKDTVVLFYDLEGKSAHSSLTKIEDILPVITLDDNLKDTATQLPKWEELHLFTDGLLEDIKEKIHYTPKSIE